MSEENNKIAFIHGRPSGHPMHAEYAKKLNADFYHEDLYLRWQDIKTSSKIRRYTSWLINAFFFPNKKKYTVFLCECLRVPPLIMKMLGILNKNQKLVALMDDESLYFLDKKRYGFFTEKLLITFLKKSDAIICIGDLQYNLTLKFIPVERHVRVFKTFNGINDLRLNELLKIEPRLESYNVVFVASISNEWRAWYKGLDILIESLNDIKEYYPLVNLSIIGDIPEDFIKNYLSKISPKNNIEIHLLGFFKNIEKILLDFSLCIHCARGEAWGISIGECMAAGIPTIISNVTGCSPMVKNVSENLICDITKESLSDRIKWYYSLNVEDRTILSDKCKESASKYSESNAIKNFEETFLKALLV